MTLARSFLTLLALAAAAAAAPLALAEPAAAASIFDPAMRWKTIVTPHFRVNHPEGYEAIARLAAGYAEEAHQLLSPYMQEVPANRTELTLMDNADMANGFGFPLPNNQIYIYLSSPQEDALSLNRYDSYLRDLLIHEYTHVLHLEKTAGLPAWIKGFLGRSYFPNMYQPAFLIEGLGVTTETRFSHGGRGREATFRTYLRLAALEDRLVDIETASGYLYNVDHPAGDAAYAYGMAFYRYVSERYGEQAPVAIANHYAANPFFGLHGVDDALRAATGKDAATLWAELHADLKRRAAEQVAAIEAQGPVTALTPVTSGELYHRHPVWSPDGALNWAEWDGHGYAYVYRQEPDGRAPKKLITKSPFGAYGFSPDGRWLYHARLWGDDRFSTYERVMRFDLEDRRIEPLGDQERLSEPALSPDGRWVVAVANNKGQQNLVKMRADGSGLKALTALEDRSQLGAPAWHPKRHLIALSAWRDGARDLYLANPETGELKPLWRDRHVELNATWSPDGRHLVFSSDRTGVFNLYAYELATGKLFRMTNVTGGLVEPAVSPDGKTVAATSFHAKGYQIVTLPYAPEAWTPVPTPGVDEAIAQPEPAVKVEAPSEPYSPWPSLRPKVWAPFAFMDDRGPVLGFTTFGQDSLMQHFLYGAAGWGVLSNRPFYSLAYSTELLYPSVSGYAFQSAFVSRPSHQGRVFSVAQQVASGGVSVTFPGLPSAFMQNRWVTGDTLALGLNFQQLSALDPIDPALPADKAPALGATNTLSVTYRYGDNYKFAYSISPEGGNLFSLGYEAGVPALGSRSRFDRVWADWRRYVGLPWQHHVLALRAMGGATTGGAEGHLFLGGFDSATYLANVDLRTTTGVGTRLMPLRGYGIGALSGPKAAALSAEYRFPLARVQRGWGVFPVYLRTLHGAVFADAGHAWEGPLRPGGLASVGVELRAQSVFMQAPADVRLGLGQGLVRQGPGAQWPQVFVDLGTSF